MKNEEIENLEWIYENLRVKQENSDDWGHLNVFRDTIDDLKRKNGFNKRLMFSCVILYAVVLVIFATAISIPFWLITGKSIFNIVGEHINKYLDIVKKT